MKKIYALYKGDKNICDGTIQEIAKKTKRTPSCIRCYKSPSKTNKNKGNRLELVFIGVEQ